MGVGLDTATLGCHHADGAVEPESPTRIILVPSFAKTGIVVLLCLETLECKTVGFEVPDWIGEMNGHREDEKDGDVVME